MQKIIVDRFDSKADWTLSRFYSDCKTIKGFGIEDEKRIVKVHGETRIDAGTYNVDLTFSPKFSKAYYRDDEGNLMDATMRNHAPEEVKAKYHTMHEVIIVEGVRGFVGIRWHWGNTDDDTEGCYCVGSVIGEKDKQAAVMFSRKKYMEIYPFIFRAWREHKSKGTRLKVEYQDNG